MFIYKKCESSITKMTSVESIYINIYIYISTDAYNDTLQDI